MRSGEATPSRPISSMSQHSVASNLSQASANLRSRPVGTPRKPRPVSIAVTGITSSPQGNDIKNIKSMNASGGIDKPPLPKVHSSKKNVTPKAEPTKKPTDKVKSAKSSATSTPRGSTPVQSPSVENMFPLGGSESYSENTFVEETLLELNEITGTDTFVDQRTSQRQTSSTANLIDIPETTAKSTEPSRETTPPSSEPAQPPAPQTTHVEPPQQQISEDRDSEMSTSMSKMRITTEEEAKAALAERRRLAREQAEREAELERQRLEAERLAEEERLRKEEEEQRKMEVEQLKLLEEAKMAEEIRLQQAIEEAQKREAEEKKRVEDEEKAKKEKEEADKKAKEEAEKARLEMEIRLKKEEEDRQARRKRVEAIMLRTRGKGSTSTTTPTKDGDESMEGSSPPNEEKMEEASLMTESDKFLDSERNHSDANSETAPVNNKHNGHHNGSIHSVSENNVTNTLLDLSTEPVDQILDLAAANGKITEPQLQNPFIGFQEKNEPPTLNDLLS